MDEQTIRGWYDHCPDVRLYTYRLEDSNMNCILIYCEGLCDTTIINDLVMPSLPQLNPKDIQTNMNLSLGQLLFTRMEEPWNEEQCSSLIFNGQLLMFFPKEDILLRLDIANKPSRQVADSNMENSTLGPRDGFIEELSTNVALIRKRLRTNRLHIEEYNVGSLKATKIVLIYMEEIAARPYLEEARQRLSSIHVEALVGVAQLQELVSDSPSSLFPLLAYTGRPDFAVDCLLHERFVIIVEGNPAVLIAPANLFLLLKSPEDIFISYGVAALGRLSRLIGLWLTICLPGFWVAILEYNQEQLPFPLLATITISRTGLPLSTPLEIALSLFFLELFREAGSRLPQSIGQPITVVGGLIIGDAAIRAGLISPSMVVISALTAVSASTLVNLNLSGNSTALRIFIFLVSATFGLFGFIISTIFMMWYLSSLRSFGVPYLSPISPVYWRDVWSALVKLPAHKSKLHPYMLGMSKRRK